MQYLNKSLNDQLLGYQILSQDHRKWPSVYEECVHVEMQNSVDNLCKGPSLKDLVCIHIFFPVFAEVYFPEAVGLKYEEDGCTNAVLLRDGVFLPPENGWGTVDSYQVVPKKENLPKATASGRCIL